MCRAEKGEKLTIGFFGGSITQGCLATEHEKAFSYRVFQWWKDTFPQGNNVSLWSFQNMAGSSDVSAGCGCGGFQRQ